MRKNSAICLFIKQIFVYSFGACHELYQMQRPQQTQDWFPLRELTEPAQPCESGRCYEELQAPYRSVRQGDPA